MPMSPKAQDRLRLFLLVLIYVVGGACTAPFVYAMFQLLGPCAAFSELPFYAFALHGSMALIFAGIVLSVLILFYRLRNDEASPSLTSGVAVIAIGALAVVLLSFAARDQVGAANDLKAPTTCCSKPVQ